MYASKRCRASGTNERYDIEKRDERFKKNDMEGI